MAVRKKRDRFGKILEEGERQRCVNGTYSYEYRYMSGGIRCSVSATTLEELREKEKLIKAGVLSRNKSTLNDVYDLWKKVREPSLKITTLQNWNRLWENHVRDSLGRKNITEIKRSSVTFFLNSLASKKGHKVKTLEMIYTIIRQVLELAVDEGAIEINPADKAWKDVSRAHRSDKKKMEALTRKQQEVLEEYMSEHPDYYTPLMTFLLWSGLRIGEALALTVKDIDFANRRITVEKSLYQIKGEEEMEFHIGTPKTENSIRTIPLFPKAEEALRKAIEMKRFKTKVDGYEPIFLSYTGRPMQASTADNALARIIRKCNDRFSAVGRELITLDASESIVPKVTVHQLRHSFATRMVESGVNVKVIQVIMGHSNINITLNVYTDVSEEFKQSAVSQMLDEMGYGNGT